MSCASVCSPSIFLGFGEKLSSAVCGFVVHGHRGAKMQVCGGAGTVPASPREACLPPGKVHVLWADVLRSLFLVRTICCPFSPRHFKAAAPLPALAVPLPAPQDPILEPGLDRKQTGIEWRTEVVKRPSTTTHRFGQRQSPPTNTRNGVQVGGLHCYAQLQRCPPSCAHQMHMAHHALGSQDE